MYLASIPPRTLHPDAAEFAGAALATMLGATSPALEQEQQQQQQQQQGQSPGQQEGDDDSNDDAAAVAAAAGAAEAAAGEVAVLPPRGKDARTVTALPFEFPEAPVTEDVAVDMVGGSVCRHFRLLLQLPCTFN